MRDNLRELGGGLAVGLRLLRRVADWLRRASGSNGANGFLQFLHLKEVQDALPYLVMGIDAADGVMALSPEGELQVRWDNTRSLRFFRDIEKTVGELTEAASPGLDGNLMLNRPGPRKSAWSPCTHWEAARWGTRTRAAS